MSGLLARTTERLRNERRAAVLTARTVRRQYKKALRLCANAIKAREIINTVARLVQERAHRQIQSVVSRCLAAVFENPYRFKIKFERKRGKTEAVPVFARDGFEYGPLDGVGGGVLDVAAFGLRVAEVLMQKPAPRRLLIQDEPFKFPSLRKGYRERVRDLLVTLAEELDFQFVVVTHDPTFEVGKVIDLDDL